MARGISKKPKVHSVDWNAREARRVISRNWAWLLFVPVFTASITAGIHSQMPPEERVQVVLKSELAIVQEAGGWVAEQASDVTLRYERVDEDAVIVTAESLRLGAASAAIAELVASLPDIAPPTARLKADDLLELRALRQYLSYLVEARVNAPPGGNERGMLTAEIVAVKRRVAQLTPFEEPDRGEPTLVSGPNALDNRRPPLRNVTLFSYMLALFATWLTVCAVERRRLLNPGTAG